MDFQVRLRCAPSNGIIVMTEGTIKSVRLNFLPGVTVFSSIRTVKFLMKTAQKTNVFGVNVFVSIACSVGFKHRITL